MPQKNYFKASVLTLILAFKIFLYYAIVHKWKEDKQNHFNMYAYELWPDFRTNRSTQASNLSHTEELGRVEVVFGLVGQNSIDLPSQSTTQLDLSCSGQIDRVDLN